MVYPFATRHAGAKCIGSYESELHAAIEQVVRRGYAIVVNLGCAEGYYAVGLARRMPTSTVVAVDYNPQALGLCRRLADANGLAKGRIRYAPEATHALGQLSAGDAFVLADVEGAELSILDPVELPNLLEADLLVELHEHATPGIETILRRRFAASHHIAAIDSKPRDPAVGVAELHGLSMRLRALALSERPTATRWLVMRAWSNLPP
jgi:hypothetical protein